MHSSCPFQALLSGQFVAQKLWRTVARQFGYRDNFGARTASA
jgi:hypothetical protein